MESAAAKGGADALVRNGTAAFRRMLVRRTAGRFQLRFLWERDLRSTSASRDFIVTPHHMVALGVRAGQEFAVGGRLEEVIGSYHNDICATGSRYDAQDVRCQGAAQLSDVEVLLVDGQGDRLHMLGAESSFQVTVALLQAYGGQDDSNYQPVPPGDLFMGDMLLEGGTHDDGADRFAAVVGGSAHFSEGARLLIRRQAGRFFRLLVGIRGSASSALSTRPWLHNTSAPFSIAARLRVLEWAPGASAAWALGGLSSPPPAHPFMPHAAEIPRVRVQLVDAHDNVLKHANCLGCLTAAMSVPDNEPCTTFGIRSNLPECLAELQWRQQANAFCETTVNSADYIAGDFISLEQCKAVCRSLPSCTAIHLYPNDIVGRDGIYFGSTCFMALGECAARPSNYRATIHYKPQLAEIPRQCLCPGEEYLGESVNHTLFAPELAAGSRYVPAWQIRSGEALVGNGLFVKFAADRLIRLQFKLAGMQMRQKAEPLLLVHPPPSLSYTPSETALPSRASMCVCASRTGFDMLDLPSSSQPSAAPRVSLQTLVELQSISCLCTPSRAESSHVRESQRRLVGHGSSAYSLRGYGYGTGTHEAAGALGISGGSLLTAAGRARRGESLHQGSDVEPACTAGSCSHGGGGGWGEGGGGEEQGGGGGEELNQESHPSPGSAQQVTLRSSHDEELYRSMCIGCCRPICYGEKEVFVGCPAGRYFTTVSTAWTNQSGCQRCPFFSYSPLYSTSIYDCTCNAGYTGPAGGPCLGMPKEPCNTFKRAVVSCETDLLVVAALRHAKSALKSKAS